MASKQMAAAAAAAASKGASTPKNASGKGDTEWADVQARTFLKWLNLQLSKVDTQAADLVDDLKNGVKLCQALEVLSKKTIKYTKTPKMKANELENCTHAFKFLESEGLKLVNIGPTDVNSGNLKLMLGLIWTIIYHYSISAGFKEAGPANSKKANAKDLLLEWVRSKIPEYNIQNFTTDWQDGRAVCALTNVIGGEPWLIPNHRQMVPEAALQNAKKGIETAKSDLAVPDLISAEDLSSCPDEHSVMTYVAFFKDASRQSTGPKLAPHLDNEDGRKKMACQHPGCKKMRDAHPKFCPEHACMHLPLGCETPAKAGTNACPAHSCQHAAAVCKDPAVGDTKACGPHKCAHPSNCGDPVVPSGNSPFCAKHACQHPSGCDKAAKDKTKFCPEHTCMYTNCSDPAAANDTWCPAHKPGGSPKKGALPPPWERDRDNWRKYEGPNLGGRCKIRVYFSSTTSSQDIRKNTQALLQLLEREKVHQRPDFEHAIPIDIFEGDMTKEKRDLIFQKAGTKVTPMLFIDDEFVGNFAQVMELNESGKLSDMLKY